MGQQEVIDFLMEQDKPVSRGQISNGMDLEPTYVSHILNKLLKWKEIECIEVNRNQAIKLLKLKSPFKGVRRRRFYYISKK